MATDTALWPEEMAYSPTPEVLETERRYWRDLDRIAEYDAWMETQMEQLENFETWSLADLLEEFETVRTLTPDQEEIIAELEREIERRRAA